MSARRTLRRLLPLLLLALFGALVAHRRAAKQPAVEREPLLLPPVQAAFVEAEARIADASVTEEIMLADLLAEASEPAHVEAELVAAEAVPEEQIAVVAAPAQEAAAHMITVVDDLLERRA